MALVGKIKSDRTVWAEFADGFRVQLRYLPREQLRRIAEGCKKVEWDKHTHKQIETYDNRLWCKKLVDAAFVTWEGLTPKILRTMIDMSEYPTEDVPFTPQDAEELLFHAYSFDTWAQNICAELSAFMAAEEAALAKNS